MLGRTLRRKALLLALLGVSGEPAFSHPPCIDYTRLHIDAAAVEIHNGLISPITARIVTGVNIFCRTTPLRGSREKREELNYTALLAVFIVPHHTCFALILLLLRPNLVPRLPPAIFHAQVAIPAVCFAICFAFQAWEFAGPHNKTDTVRARVLFTAVRAGWVKVRTCYISVSKYRCMVCSRYVGSYFFYYCRSHEMGSTTYHTRERVSKLDCSAASGARRVPTPTDVFNIYSPACQVWFRQMSR